MAASMERPCFLMVEIAANDTESRGPLIAAKGARNLLLDFDHSQISFRKVVRKRHREVIQESQHLFGPFEQGIQEIFRVVLFATT